MSDIYRQLNDNYYTQNRELIISIQEAERQRIARDLHDTSLQNLTHILHQLELCNLYLDKDITQARLEMLSIKQGINFVIDEIRDIIYDLRPMTFDDFGLKETLDNLFVFLKKHFEFDFEVNIEKIESKDSFVLLSIYRIAKECVINALKHSNGSKLYFECTSDNVNCILRIEDNGKGFSKKDVIEKKNHFGLSVVFERIELLNGEISFDTENGEGTKILIKIPLKFKIENYRIT